MASIERITLFNIPKEEDRLRLVEEYKQLSKTAVKVCVPHFSKKKENFRKSRIGTDKTKSDWHRMASHTSQMSPLARRLRTLAARDTISASSPRLRLSMI